MRWGLPVPPATPGNTNVCESEHRPGPSLGRKGIFAMASVSSAHFLVQGTVGRLRVLLYSFDMNGVQCCILICSRCDGSGLCRKRLVKLWTKVGGGQEV